MMTCPRRAEVGSTEENKDEFSSGHGLISQVRGCSYCGSMEPEDVLRFMEDGVELGPTDKNYKVYVEGQNKSGKFYFQHFNEEQKNKFIELYNQKPRTFTIGYPGYFYVLPYFCRREVQ